ncbi:zinc finger MYM-type protein 1-like [Camellia sinensis]|uniref:zinc finger MYM-type protein 1-like n=1 Tax=Camellia sinensis TaxID=4442 RepID=UPI001036C958|nr:zinc finger MYM-type protein 1-like [Camellia sinensis]
MGMMETGLNKGPVHFNCFPDFTLSLRDPHILKALTLNIQLHDKLEVNLEEQSTKPTKTLDQPLLNLPNHRSKRTSLVTNDQSTVKAIEQLFTKLTPNDTSTSKDKGLTVLNQQPYTNTIFDQSDTDTTDNEINQLAQQFQSSHLNKIHYPKVNPHNTKNCSSSSSDQPDNTSSDYQSPSDDSDNSINIGCNDVCCKPVKQITVLTKTTQEESALIDLIAKDAAFCLCCYLFKPDIGDQAGGDSFVGKGFSNWKKKEKIQTHVGSPNSVHNEASSNCQDLLNQNQHIKMIFFKQFDQARIEYRTRLNSSVDCVKFLLRQGLAFHGHDESENSSNQGNFLELLKFLADHNEDVKMVALSNAPQNLKLASPDIQKDIVNVAAFETINVIIRDLGDALFSVLIDEARDISIKEQMAVVIRYVNKKGQVIERFLGIEHVANSNALSLTQAMENLFSKLGLSIFRLRGQGYDGASNMQGEFNGLKTLILKENPCAYYVHCFAHQLQLALVVVAKNHNQIALLFTLVSNVVNVVETSCKLRDIVREKQAAKVAEALNTRELSSGQGLNQKTNLKCAGDTHWGSHYGTLVSLASMFSTVIDVLEMISNNDSNSEQRAESNVLLNSII